MDYALYIASALGAVALFMMMPRRSTSPRRIGAILGAATLGGLWLVLHRYLPIAPGSAPAPGSGGDIAAEIDGESGVGLYYYLFSALAIGAAVRVITHTKPVYAALWFVMVVLASSGLFLVLGAEFMAFAMIIIYGGAILVTYVFVIMLASHAGDADEVTGPRYDRVAREPAAAVAVGFVLLAVLLGIAFDQKQLTPNPAAAAASDATIVATVLQDRPAGRPTATKPAHESGAAIKDAPVTLDNSERVGLDLFESHPLGLELAGVILLVSLVGAVVIAKQHGEMEEKAVSA